MPRAAYYLPLVPVALILVSCCCATAPKPAGQQQAGAQPAAAPPKPVATPEVQAERKKLLEDYATKGVIAKWQGDGTHARLWVRAGFYALDFDAKGTVASLAFAYLYQTAMGEKADLSDFRRVDLVDVQTGKDVGAWSPSLGGLRLD